MMKKRVLVALGCLLAALALLPLGAWAQGPARGALVTAGVFDSKDLTFVYDPMGNPMSVRAHEKGGELWVVKVADEDVRIPADAFAQRVASGKEITFKVKLAENHLGDRGNMCEFDIPSEWWEVAEWRVNGEVVTGATATSEQYKGSSYTYTVKPGDDALHIGVRLQRRKFAVVAQYNNVDPGDKWLSIKEGTKTTELKSGELHGYDVSSVIRVYNMAWHDLTDFTVNGESRGKIQNAAGNELLLTYKMAEGDLYLKASYPLNSYARRYIITDCEGDGEWVRF